MSKEIATIARTTEILEEYDLFPKKNYGQNFIIEPEIVRSIASLSTADENTCVMEIGPGIGALTEQLAKLSKHVLAYEIDNKLLPVLDDVLSEYDNIEIVGCDFLERNIKEDVSKLREMADHFVICANLPYYVTTPILFHIIDSEINPECMTFMVQKEMADRFMANCSSKDYNALSVILQYLYDIKVVKKISSTVFLPKPKVDSIVIQFTPLNNPRVKDFSRFNEFVKACFIQRRKTIYNNLKEYIQDKDKVLDLLKKADIEQTRRAESLTLDEFIELFNTYEN